jgi:hypothetical protein
MMQDTAAGRSGLTLARGGIAAGLVLLLVASAGAASAQQVVEPGSTVAFAEPDLQNRGTPFPADAFNTGLCLTIPQFPSAEAPRLGLALQGVTSLLGARCQVHQYNEFTIPAAAGAEPAGDVLLAEVSGVVKLGGVLAMIGAGRTKSSYVVDVMDVTDGEENATVVASQLLGIDELMGTILNTSLGVTVDIEGGFPYLGASGAFNLGIQLPIQIKRVDSTYEFGIHALLERGRIYRVKVSVNGALDVEVGAGLGFVLFPAIPNGDLISDQLPQLLDPQMWIDLMPFRSLAGANVCGLEIPDFNIDGVKDLLPNLDFDLPELDFEFPRLSVNIGDPIGRLTFTNGFDADILSPTNIPILDYQQAIDLASDPQELLTQVGLPSDALGLFDCFLDIASGENMVLNDILPQIGIEVTELGVTVDDDRIERIDQFVQQQVNQILGTIDATTLALDQNLVASYDQFSTDLTTATTMLSDTVTTEFSERTMQLDDAVTTFTDELITQFDELNELVEMEFSDLNDALDATAARELRLKIEESLSTDDQHKIAQFMLPDALGGKLELVRLCVEDMIARVTAAGLDALDADTYFAQGDAAFLETEFKEAFMNYTIAYRNAVMLLAEQEVTRR